MPVGLAVTPRTWTRRVASSITKQHVQTLEQDRVDVEEVGGQDPFGLRGQELPPGQAPRTLIFLDDSGERTILALAGPGRLNRYSLADLPGLPEADAVWVESYATFPREIAVAASGAMLAVPPPDDPALSGPADLLVGSKSQLPAAWRQAPLQAARAAMGERLRLVVATDGSHGAVAYGDAIPCAVPAQPAQQVDATGAGDAFAAGLLHGLLEGWELLAAMELGTAWAAAAVEELQSIPPGIEAVLGPQA
jgi:sugar/nucleoside kinase (ribokinase family)